jgi:hypothetical protein
MAQAANIVLADAQATPVNHTFIPIGPGANGEMFFEDQSGSTPIGYNRISVSVKRGAIGRAGDSQGDRTARVVIRLYEPTLETVGTADNGITPPPRVAYQLTSTVEFLMSERSLQLERKNIRKFTEKVLADAQIVNLIENLVPIW